MRKEEMKDPKAYTGIMGLGPSNDINMCDKVVCKSGCRLRAIVRLTLSGLGFTFLVCGVVVAMVGSSGTGK